MHDNNLKRHYNLNTFKNIYMNICTIIVSFILLLLLVFGGNISIDINFDSFNKLFNI